MCNHSKYLVLHHHDNMPAYLILYLHVCLNDPRHSVGDVVIYWPGTEQFVSHRPVSWYICIVEAAVLQALQNTAVSETHPGFNGDLQQESEAAFDADRL